MIKHVIRVNPRGAQGKRGEKGESGFSPIIEVVPMEDSTSFRLKITNRDNVIFTPIMESIEFTDLGGTYIRKIDGNFYLMNADTASTTQQGEIQLATSSDIETDNDYKAVTPALMKSYTTSEIESILSDALPNYGYNFRGAVIDIIKDISKLPDIGEEGDKFLIRDTNQLSEWTTSHWETADIDNLENGDLWRLTNTQNATFFLFDSWYYLGGQVIEQSGVTEDTYRVGLQDVVAQVVFKSDYTSDVSLTRTALLQPATIMPESYGQDNDVATEDVLNFDILTPVTPDENMPDFLFLPTYNTNVDSILFRDTLPISFYNNDYAIREDLLETREFSSSEVHTAIRNFLWIAGINGGEGGSETQQTDFINYLGGKSGTEYESAMNLTWRNDYVCYFWLKPYSTDGAHVMSKNAIAYLLGYNDRNYITNVFPKLGYYDNVQFKAKYPLNETQATATRELRFLTEIPNRLIRTPIDSSMNNYICKYDYPAVGWNLNGASISLQDSTSATTLIRRESSWKEILKSEDKFRIYDDRVFIPMDLITKTDTSSIPDIELINYIQNKVSQLVECPIRWYQNGNLDVNTPVVRFPAGFALKFNPNNLPTDKANWTFNSGNYAPLVKDVPYDGYAGNMYNAYNPHIKITNYNYEDYKTFNLYFTYQEYFEDNGLPVKPLQFQIVDVVQTNPPKEQIQYYEMNFNSSDLNFNIYDNTGNIIPAKSISISDFTGSNTSDENMQFVDYVNGKLYFIDNAMSNTISIGSAICEVTIVFDLNDEEIIHKEYLTVYAFRGKEYDDSIPNFNNGYDIIAGKTYRCLTNGLLKYTVSTDDDHNTKKVYIGRNKDNLFEMCSVNQTSSGSVGITIVDMVNITAGSIFRTEANGKFYSVTSAGALEEI